MKVIRFQNRVSASNATLLIAALFAALGWWIQGDYTYEYGFGYLLSALTALLLSLLNAKFELIRYRSRMVASVFFMYVGASTFLHPLQESTIMALSMAVSFYFMFDSYGKRAPMSSTFQMFLALSIGSLFFPKLIFFALFFLLFMSVQLRTITLRTFFAGVLGVFTPYWFWYGYQLTQHDITPFVQHFADLKKITPIAWNNGIVFDLSTIDLKRKVLFCSLTWIALIATIRYIRSNLDDKTRVRTFYHIFIILELTTLVIIILQPQYFDQLFAILLIFASPIIAHFFAHTHRWITNALFILFLLQMIALTFYDLWMPLLTP